jgi:hypothetical protein
MIMLLIKARNLYFEILRGLGKVLEHRRSMENSDSSDDRLANLLIYQLYSVSEIHDPYLNQIERIMFAMAMFIGLLETERNRFHTNPYILLHDWSRVCQHVMEWNVALGDRANELQVLNSLVPRQYVRNCLKLFRQYLCETVLTRCSDEEHMSSLLDTQLPCFISYLQRLQQHVVIGGNDSDPKSCLKTLKMRLHPQEFSPSSLMETMLEVHVDMGDEWIRDSNGAHSIFNPIHTMYNREEEIPSQNLTVFQCHSSIDTHYWRSMRWQATLLCDLSICLQKHVPFIEKWFGGEVSAHSTKMQRGARFRMKEHACANMANLLHLHHQYIIWIAQMSIYGNAIHDSGEEEEEGDVNSHHNVPFMYIKLHRFVKDQLLSISTSMLTQLFHGFCLMRSIVSSSAAHHTSLPVVVELRCQYANALLCTLADNTLRTLESRWTSSQSEFPGITTDKDEILSEADLIVAKKECAFFEIRLKVAQETVEQKAKQWEIVKQVALQTLDASNAIMTYPHHNILAEQVLSMLYDYSIFSYYNEHTIVSSHAMERKVAITGYPALILDRIDEGILIFNQETLRNFDYYYTSMSQMDPAEIEITLYLMELREKGIHYLQLARSSACHTTKEDSLCHRLMSTLCLELIRGLRQILVADIQMEEIPMPWLSSLLDRCVKFFQQADEVYQTLLRNSDKKVVEHIEPKAYSIMKCRLLHMIVGIRAQILLQNENVCLTFLRSFDSALSSNAVYKDVEEMNLLEETIQLQKSMDQGFRDSSDRYKCLDEIQSIWHLVQEPLHALTVSFANEDVAETPIAKELLFWIEKALEIALLDFESRDLLIGNYDRILTSFPILPFEDNVEGDLYQELFVENHKWLYQCCELVLEASVEQASHGESETASSLKCLEELFQKHTGEQYFHVKERALCIVSNIVSCIETRRIEELEANLDF